MWGGFDGPDHTVPSTPRPLIGTYSYLLTVEAGVVVGEVEVIEEAGVVVGGVEVIEEAGGQEGGYFTRPAAGRESITIDAS